MVPKNRRIKLEIKNRTISKHKKVNSILSNVHMDKNKILKEPKNFFKKCKELSKTKNTIYQNLWTDIPHTNKGNL